ncbi:MAG: alpha/beta hydrolase [Phaeodactylibacter sp.]|nr:alpha/beta hydrolase [Phaeodactylibacter sp.]
MLITAALLLAGAFLLLSVLRAWSPGKPRPFPDGDGKPLAGSISEKTFIDINGVRQGMFIKGRDAGKPVLLYLHGGMPDYFLTQRYPTGLDEDFVVVWWEQRGSGLSFHAGPATTEQLVADALALTDYLRRRFNQEKIYLMGHSGGTFIGIQVAARAPERYHAYIGVAQISHQLRSEQLAYEYMLQQFRESGNRRMVRKLEAVPVTATGGLPAAYLRLRDPAMHRLGIGTMHNMNSVISGILLPSWQFREYTLREKFNLWRAKFRSGVSMVWDDVLATDLKEKAPEAALPVYFLHGIYDYTCSYSEAKAYLQRLKAPVKGFYTFRQSAHSPLFEEPEKMRRILREDVLAGASRLADPARLSLSSPNR